MNIKVIAVNLFKIIFIMSISTLFSSGTCNGQDKKKQEATVRPESCRRRILSSQQKFTSQGDDRLF